MNKYYYDIVFKKGGRLGGHNLTKFEIKEDFLVLEGFDFIDYVREPETQYWQARYDLADIKEFKIEIMEDEDNGD